MPEDKCRDDGWIVTYTGRRINPLNPDPTDVAIEDIAHSLANQCRFTGHTYKFYSTAQHSLHVSELVPSELGLWGLLHDASEAYISDIARPVKYMEPFATFYRGAEATLLKAIMDHFELPWPEDPEIKIADKIMLRTEQRDLMPNKFHGDPHTPAGVVMKNHLQPWPPELAERAFLARYKRLSGKDVITLNRNNQLRGAGFLKKHASV